MSSGKKRRQRALSQIDPNILAQVYRQSTERNPHYHPDRSENDFLSFCAGIHAALTDTQLRPFILQSMGQTRTGPWQQPGQQRQQPDMTNLPPNIQTALSQVRQQRRSLAAVAA